MIYPFEIERWVNERKTLGGFLQPHLFPDETNKSRRAVRMGDFSMECWMATEGRRELSEVRRYLDFLAQMHRRFAHIRKEMTYENREATHQAGHDRWTAGCAGDYMMPIAAYLYYLQSRGLRGAVLECGVFKGGSTCCLSWVCQRLGFSLYAADSFEGLPSSEGHYGRGDFKGGYEEVRSNLERLGSGMTIELVKGFYADSLKGFNEPLVAIWLDVDLKQSVLDALGHTYSRLVPNGIICSDGLVDGVDFEQGRIKGEGGEPRGLVEFFASTRIPYKAKPGGPRGLGIIVPQCANDENLLYEYDKLVELIKLAELPHRTAIPYRNSSPPAMTAPNDRTSCARYAQELYSGSGKIVELGCWLGSLTVPMVWGLRHNRREEARQQTVEVFDHFKWDAIMEDYVKGTPMEGRTPIGGNYQPVYEEQIAPVRDRVAVHAADLTTAKWTGGPIEFLLIDVMKSMPLARNIAREFFPALIPGSSYVFHQDYIHFFHGWIHMAMYILRDFFDLVFQIPYSTTLVFKCTKRIDLASIRLPESPQEFTDAEIDQAFDYAMQSVSPATHHRIAAARTMMFWHQGNPQEALRLYRKYTDGPYAASTEFKRLRYFCERFGLMTFDKTATEPARRDRSDSSAPANPGDQAATPAESRKYDASGNSVLADVERHVFLQNHYRNHQLHRFSKAEPEHVGIPVNTETRCGNSAGASDPTVCQTACELRAAANTLRLAAISVAAPITHPFIEAVTSAFARCPVRECLHPKIVQEIHRAARAHSAVLCQFLDRFRSFEPIGSDLCLALAIADVALGVRRFVEVQAILATLYQRHNLDFRFQDVCFRCEQYMRFGNPRLNRIGFEKRGYLCPHAFTGMLVDATGELFPCCGPMTSRSFGTLKGQESAIDIMNSPFAHRMRQSVLNGSYRYCAKLHCPVFQNSLVPSSKKGTETLLRGLNLREHAQRTLWPRFVELALDRTCNLACTFCRRKKIAEPNHAVDFWSSILSRDIDPLLRTACCVVFSGTGDPFASRVYRGLMRRLNRREYPKLSIILLTNGLLLDPPTWREFQHLSGMIAILSISIDAASEETYRNLRRGGDFQRLLQNLAFFKSLRDRGDIYKLKFNFIVQRDNFREMEAFYKLSTDFQVDTIHYQQLANIYQADPDGEFMAKRVDLTFHPQHDEFRAILQRPFMRDDRVVNGFRHLTR